MKPTPRDPLPDQGIAIQPGDRFVQVFPPGKATLEVESHLDAEHVAVRRDTGARQVFPISSLLNPSYWEPAALDQQGLYPEGKDGPS